jgi:hypothetical protein
MGIPILAQEVRDGLTKQKKCKGKKVVSDKTDLDHDYDPSYDIDNQSESDDDCEDDLINEDNIEVRCITRPIRQYLASLLLPSTSILLFNVLQHVL